MNSVVESVKIEGERVKIKKRVLWIGAVLLIVSIVIFLSWLFGQKSYGNIASPDPVTETKAKELIGQSVYDGKYITFTYPSDFKRRVESESVKYPLLERTYFTQGDIAGRKIAMTIQDNTGYSLEEYSSYRIRTAEPNTYQQKTFEEAGLRATVFVKEANGPEVALFFEEKNRVASIVLSSLTTSEGLEGEARTLLQSFRWKNE